MSLIFFLHLLTCAFIAIGHTQSGEVANTIYWIERSSQLEFGQYGKIYWTAWYFITTTITTVGYGDIFGITIGEKIYIIFLLFSGILCFTLIQQRTRSLIKEQTMLSVLAKAHHDAIEFLFLVDDPIPTAIHDVFYDSLANLKVRESEKSTWAAFNQNKFYKTLPPRLQEKLV